MDCPLTRFSSANRRRILAIPRPIEPTSRFQPTHSRDSPAHELTARRRTVAPINSASGEESGRTNLAAHLGSAPAPRGRWRGCDATAVAIGRRLLRCLAGGGGAGAGGGASRQARAGGEGEGLYGEGGKLAVGRSAMTRKKGRRGAGGREERRGPRKR